MSNSRSLLGFFVIGASLLIAIWLGISLVTDQLQTLAYVAGGTTLIVCAVLGKRIWMIIPLAMALNVTLRIPGQPSTLLLAQALFCGFCVLLFFTRQLPLKIRFNELDFWTLLLIICVGQAYLRNPVGLNIFGGETVGARPYAIFGATLTTSVILGNLRIPAMDLRWLLRLQIIGGLVNLAVLSVGYFVPRLGIWVGSADVQALNTGYDDGQYGINRASRISFLGTFAEKLSIWIGAFKSPIKACFHPIWAPLVLLSFGFAALSGFRNDIAAVGLAYLVAIAYRGGVPHVAIASMTLVVVIAFLAFVNVLTPLPGNMQRALSFFPGTWDEYHVRDAENSTQWRVDMWEAALLTDNWIQNKWLGDGLGMTRGELDYIQSLKDEQIGGAVGTGKLNKDQMLMMASNNYHSGPVSTIRTTGYVGLAILLLAQIRLAVHAHREIKRARKTEWFPLALIVGIPIIYYPIFFVFVYGDFGSTISAYLISAAFIHVLQNNLPISASHTRLSVAEPNKTSQSLSNT